jgi:hypothetical protein
MVCRDEIMCITQGMDMIGVLYIHVAMALSNSNDTPFSLNFLASCFLNFLLTIDTFSLFFVD